jgi:predicted component of type VI protein secretion system
MKVWLRNSCPSPERGDICLEVFPVVLGRGGDCDISVLIGLVSRRHCRFIRRGDEVCVQDLESLNGTYVNGRPANHPTPLRHGDELRLGPLAYRVAVLAGHDSGTMCMGPTSSELPSS